MDNISIEQLKKFSPEDTKAISNLASKLGNNNMPFLDADMQEILDSPNISILVARERSDQKIIGMATIAVYRIPYTKKSYLDDFVIDEEYRGRGIGTKLFEKAINFAKEKGAAYVDFTSNPNRVEGNKLYEKLGFKKRNTNVYRLVF